MCEAGMREGVIQVLCKTIGSGVVSNSSEKNVRRYTVQYYQLYKGGVNFPDKKRY